MAERPVAIPKQKPLPAAPVQGFSVSRDVPRAANDDQELPGDSPIPSFNAPAANDDAERETDRRSILREGQQRVRLIAEKQVEEAAQTARLALHEARDQGNDWVSKAALGSVVGALFWFPFQLVWGDLVTKGESAFVSPVSWRAVLPKLNAILPDILAKAVAAFLLVALFLLGAVQLAAVFVLAYLVASFINDPAATLYGALSSFGMIADIIVDFVL